MNIAAVRQDLRQLTPYNVYLGKLPPKLAQPIKNYIRLLNQQLEIDIPKTISTVVLTNYVDWRQVDGIPQYINLYTFGTFRSTYSVIDRMARALTPLYVEIQVLPVITPILNAHWKVIRREKRLVYRKITQHGILGFERGDGTWNLKMPMQK